MRLRFQPLLVTIFVGALPLHVHAELPARKFLPVTLASTIAQTAYEACTKQGYHVSVHVVGGEGQTIVALRGDGASPHTFENSQRKAYTARTFRFLPGNSRSA